LETAWIAVIASLGGVLLGGMINFLGDAFRWRHEDRQAERQQAAKRDEERVALCVEFATLGDELMSSLHNFADFQEVNPTGWRTDPFVQRQLENLETAWSSFNRTYNALRIFGMGNLRESADTLESFVAINFAAAFPPASEKPSSGDWADVVNPFLEAVANELEMTPAVKPAVHSVRPGPASHTGELRT
jgi:hypothetical protein